ncbi:IclR family transcriptional regulator [Antarctobacter sp.]|uniref:IclR family transcriptional regulator n=1 Tax=Antarctobacter sp. TaxID=1872577 RepID=UPI003A8EF9FB
MGRELQSSIVDKCATVLDTLAASQSTMSFTEIVETTSFTKSSAHRIIAILLGEEMLSYEERTRSYTLGPRVLNWARAAWQKTDLQQISDAELAELRDRTGLNVAVSIPNGDAVMFIRTLDTKSVRYAAKVGELSPLHCTAAGKLFLAYDGNEGKGTLPAGYELEKYTETTITDPDRLADELSRIRSQGYATCDREEFLQVSGIAAPVLDYQSKIIAALSLWAPTNVASIESLLPHVPVLKETAALISARFGAMA